MRSSGFAVAIGSILALPGLIRAQNLPGTTLLTANDDFAKVMVDGINRYLDRRLADSPRLRDKRWQVDTSSPAFIYPQVIGLPFRVCGVYGIFGAMAELHHFSAGPPTWMVGWKENWPARNFQTSG